MTKIAKSPSAVPKEELRQRILSDTDQFFREWPQQYSDMEKRGRKALRRKLGEAAVLVKVAQERPAILHRIPTQTNIKPKDRPFQPDALVKDVVYFLMSPTGKDEISQASKYITAIRFILSEKAEDEEEFAELLKEAGGIESACKKARAKGICEAKEKSESKTDPLADTEIAETKDDRLPEFDKDYWEKLTHVDMGADAKRIYAARTVLVRLCIKDVPNLSSWKLITGEIVKIED